MICSYCQATNELDATFCTSCGLSVTPQPQSRVVTPPPIYGQPYAAAAPAPAPSAPPSEIEALNYNRFVNMLCEGQGFLAQLAIRFYYFTGLKTYQVTDHDCFVVPNLRRDAVEITAHIKREMDGLGYQELMTTFLYMRAEHIETLPYLSQRITNLSRAEGGLPSKDSILMLLIGGVRLFIELFWGILFLIVDFLKWIGNALSQSAGAAIRTVGREGNDEMLTGKRLLLASTYRHTRTYTYVRDVGPETYVGWFTHHEPPPGMLWLFAPVLLYLATSFFAQFYIRALMGPFAEMAGASIPMGMGLLSTIFGVGGVAYILWFAPWFLDRVGALPQPRYISSLVFVLWALLGLFGTALVASGGSPDTFMMILSATATMSTFMLLFAGLIVFFRTLFWPVTHFDQFDAETHSRIVEERVAVILRGLLDDAGYSQEQANDILSGNNPGAGRYRRARI